MNIEKHIINAVTVIKAQISELKHHEHILINGLYQVNDHGLEGICETDMYSDIMWWKDAMNQPQYSYGVQHVECSE